MAKLNVLSSALVLVLSTGVFVSTPALSANVAQSICQYTAADDKKRLRSFLKSNKLKVRNIYKGIKCNNLNLLEFASKSGSVKVGSLLIGKLPKKVVTKELASITNKELSQVAQNRLK